MWASVNHERRGTEVKQFPEEGFLSKKGSYIKVSHPVYDEAEYCVNRAALTSPGNSNCAGRHDRRSVDAWWR